MGYREFNALDFVYSGKLSIDKNFWTELKPNNFDVQRFYAPSKILSQDWPEILKLKYNIEPAIEYDMEIVGLPLKITRKMIKSKKSKIKKYKSMILENPELIEHPKEITPEDWLESEKIKMAAKESAQETLEMLGKRERKKIIPTEFEEKIKRWHRGYGFLVEYTEMVGFLFPRPKDEKSLKYEVIREFLFNIQDNYFSGIILSLAQEPNTNRAIWGFRRDMATSWEDKFPKEFVGKMNNLAENLEAILK